MESKTRLLRKRKAALLRLKKYHQPVTEANHNRDQDGCSITATNAALAANFWETSIRAGTFLADREAVRS